MRPKPTLARFSDSSCVVFCWADCNCVTVRQGEEVRQLDTTSNMAVEDGERHEVRMRLHLKDLPESRGTDTAEGRIFLGYVGAAAPRELVAQVALSWKMLPADDLIWCIF